MKNIFSTRVILIFFATISLTAKSQIAITYFPFQSLLGVNTNTDKLVWLDYKIETNTFASNLNMELSPKINFIRKENVNYYFGPGISFNPVYYGSDLSITNGYFLDFGARAKPFTKCRNLQILFELSPYINNQFVSGNIRTRLGISYNFGKKSDKNLINKENKDKIE